MQKLCDAFHERDGELVVEACGNVVFRTMETDVSFYTHTHTCNTPSAQVAKFALDLKKKFEYSSPTHTASSSAAVSKLQQSPSTAGPVDSGASVSGPLPDMKNELFGESSSAQAARNQPATEPVTDPGEEAERDSERFEGDQEEGDEEDDENAYGGALT